MKVWICKIGFDYEGSSVVKVLSSKDAAEKWLTKTVQFLELPYSAKNRIPGDYAYYEEHTVDE